MLGPGRGSPGAGGPSVWQTLPVFPPIRTERLVLRPFRPEDTDALVARRNEAEVARLQNWTLPFTREAAEELVEALVAMDGPADGEWWMLVIADPDTDEALGDLAFNLSWGGRASEIGYTLARRHWGNGYATEALNGLLEWLFQVLKVTRVSGLLHPDNVASAMVLERTGFVFEGHTRLSYWVGDDNSDDWIYGLTRADWDAWRSRPSNPPADVSLVEITPDLRGDVLALRTHKTQERMVPPVAVAFADALFPDVVGGEAVEQWMRAVLADGDLAGLVMIGLPTSHRPEPQLGGLLIDRMHQRRGVGTRAVQLIADLCREEGWAGLSARWREGRGSPGPFLGRLGFVPTGSAVDGNIEGRLAL